MSVEIEATYRGDLHCAVRHGPSGDSFSTDAPVDNRGKGEHFSPTDLLAASIGSCTLTIMGIAATDRGIDITGARARVVKEMGAEPRRHVARLAVEFTLPASLDARQRALMEGCARGCPVCASLGPLTKVDLTFHYR
jgi:putative redox protein